MERQMIEKILLMKKLKNLSCSLNSYTNEELMKIQGENTSVEKIAINAENICEEDVINNFINLFPNAYYLSITASNFSYDSENITLLIREDPNSKIKSFELDLNRKILFYLIVHLMKN